MSFNDADFLDSIGKIIVFLLFLLSIFLLTVKGEKRLSNGIFASFLLVTAFDLSGLFLGEFYVDHPQLLHLKTASSLLQMPLFYGYVLTICQVKFKLQWKQLMHAVPFLAFLLVFSLNVIPEQNKSLYELAGEVQYVAYIVAIFAALTQHRRVYLENFSNPDYSAYKWLFQATVLFCIAHALVLTRSLLGYFNVDPSWAPLANVIVTCSALLVTCWLVLKVMYQPQIFKDFEQPLKPISTPKTKASTPEKQDELAKVKAFMEEEKPYLHYDLNLRKLANQLQMEEKELSLLINQQTGKHFFDFVNGYRINEAKSLLENPEMSKVTVLEILYQVGFNSKSSFYTAFKKETGQTPVNYRKSFT